MKEWWKTRPFFNKVSWLTIFLRAAAHQVRRTKRWMITCVYMCTHECTTIPIFHHLYFWSLWDIGDLTEQTLMSLCVLVWRMWVERQKVCVCVHTCVSVCAHLPVKDNTPDEAEGQLVVPIHNIRPSYVHQIHLKEEAAKEILKWLQFLMRLRSQHFYQTWD